MGMPCRHARAVFIPSTPKYYTKSRETNQHGTATNHPSRDKHCELVAQQPPRIFNIEYESLLFLLSMPRSFTFLTLYALFLRLLLILRWVTVGAL